MMKTKQQRLLKVGITSIVSRVLLFCNNIFQGTIKNYATFNASMKNHLHIRYLSKSLFDQEQMLMFLYIFSEL